MTPSNFLSRATRASMLIAAATAVIVALGIASPVTVQSSELGVNGLSSDPASTGVPSSLEGIGGATSGTPKAEVTGKVYDFGSVLNAVPVAHVFKIHNAGMGTLIIVGVQTSCGCTAAKPTRNQLAPGEDSDIAVTFDTRFDKGPATRTITVSTNDPAAKSIVLTIKGDVKVQVDATPAQVAFGDVKHGTDQTRQVLLNDLVAGTDPTKPPQEFKVQSMTNASPNIKVAAAPRTDGKAGAALTVTLLSTMPIGAFDDTIKVATSRAPVDITVFGNVQGDITVKPAQVSFGVVPHRQGTLRFVRLVNAGTRPMKVTGVTSSNVSVSATAEPVEAGKEYKITLELRPNTPDGALRGQLAITTDDPQQQTLSLPYFGIIGSYRG
ncbi:MAG: hypothetical protein QOG61_2462 [Candidatus Binataceae bacterium]|nr:hypothetical protein [Candidatus Binataceae bacterium]